MQSIKLSGILFVVLISSADKFNNVLVKVNAPKKNLDNITSRVFLLKNPFYLEIPDRRTS